MNKVALLFLTVMLLFCCPLGYAEAGTGFLDDMTLEELNMALTTLKKLQTAIELKITTYSETPPVTESSVIVSANDVEYISDREFFYHSGDEMYYIRFALKDKNKNRVISPCTITARLVNSSGDVVYSITNGKLDTDDFWTWTWNNEEYSSYNGYYATIPITAENILSGSDAEGTMYITVTLDNGSVFSEKAISVDDLPIIPTTLSYAKLPIGIMNGKGNLTKESDITCAVNITNITYKVKGTDWIDVFLSGEVIAAPLGSTARCRIAWRLKDSGGYVIDSGALYTDALGYGEKFKDLSFRIFDVKAGTYTLEFQHTSN